MSIYFFIEFIVCFVGFIIPAKSQESMKIYNPIEVPSIQVAASSEFLGFPAVETINGSGIKNHRYLSGHHEIAVSTIRPCENNSNLLVRLVNTSRWPVKSSFIWNETIPSKIYECDNDETIKRTFNGESFWMQPYETLTLKFEY